MAAPRLADLLAPFPGRLAFAARISLICALTVLIAETYETIEIALTAYIVFFLNKEDRTSSLIMHIAAMILMALIIGTVFLVAIFVIDHPVWRVTAMALMSFVILFLGSASKLSVIAPVMALIVAYALDFLGLIPQGELATRILLYAWLLIGVPAFAGFIVNLPLGTPPRLLAERILIKRLRTVAAYLREGGNERCARLQNLLQEGNAGLMKYLNLARIEHTVPAQDLAALKAAADSSFRLVSLIESLAVLPEAYPSSEDKAKLAETAEAMAAIFEKGLYPVEIEASLSSGSHPLLTEIDRTLQNFALAPPDAEAQKPEAKPKEKSGFFLPDAFTNPDHVRHALKTTAAAMICYIFYLQIDWTGIHTCLITCYIVSLGSAAETTHKMMLRFIGAAIGAATGTLILIFVIPHIESIGALMILVFLGALPAAWVAAGGERIAYAGFQIAFAFFLCAIQGYGPGFDLTIPRDRVIGIFVGNLVMYVMATQVWPVSVSRRVGATITAALRGLRDMARAASQPAWNAAAIAARGALSKLDNELELIAFEPSSLRPNAAWRDARAKVSAELKTVFRLLTPLTPPQDPASMSDIARHLEQLDRSREEGESFDAAAVIAAPVADMAPTRPDFIPSLKATLDHQIDQLTLALAEAARTEISLQPLSESREPASHAAS